MCIRDRFSKSWTTLTLQRWLFWLLSPAVFPVTVSYTHLRAHETMANIVCRLLLLMIRRPPRSTPLYSSAASDVYKRQVFEIVDYVDPAEVAVLALESRSLPSEAAVSWIAEKCRISPGCLSILVSPTASLVGSVQIAARIVETGLHKMHEVGFDIGTVISGFGSCPLAPVAGDDLKAIGRTNDAVLYGGRAWYTVETDDALIQDVIEVLPSLASSDYGVPFGELFERYGGNFYQIDPLLFSPAELSITNATSGRTFRAGHVDAAMVEKVLLG